MDKRLTLFLLLSHKHKTLIFNQANPARFVSVCSVCFRLPSLPCIWVFPDCCLPSFCGVWSCLCENELSSCACSLHNPSLETHVLCRPLFSLVLPLPFVLPRSDLTVTSKPVTFSNSTYLSFLSFTHSWGWSQHLKALFKCFSSSMRSAQSTYLWRVWVL